MKILLLEDDNVLNDSISYILLKNGYRVSSFYDGDSVLESKEKYDLHILDINVPNTDGVEVLKYITENSFKPRVIMISSNIDIESIKKSYSLGACDYIKKPFDLEELLCKIEIISKELNKVINLSPLLKYDFENKILYKNDVETKFTRKESLLFHLLIEKVNQTVTQDDIELVVYDNQATNHVNIRALVKRLRDKIGEDIIKTEIDRGYRINLI